MVGHSPNVWLAMRRVLRRAGLVAAGLAVLLVPACAPTVATDEPAGAGAGAGAVEGVARSSAPPVALAAPLAGELELSLDDARARPVAEVLPRAPGRELAPAHVERAGWSGDGQAFVHCRPLVSACTECRVIAIDGTSTSFESGPGCGEQALAASTFDARLAALALAPATTRWRDGADVVLVLETREHERTNAGEPRPMLKLGARRRTGGPPAWLLHVDPCEGCGTDQACAAVAHLDALALSPSGEQLAVLVHQRSSQGNEAVRVELLAASHVAATARAPASRAAP